MSHFTVYVIVPKNKKPGDKYLEEVLAPYDEAKEVPEYNRKCHCIGHRVGDAAMKSAEKKFGPFPDIRAAYHALPEAKRTEKKWKEMSGKFIAFVTKEEKRLKPKAKPDKNCDSCKGKGTYKSIYNPKSQWDWWVIGGRWSGLIRGLDRGESSALADNLEKAGKIKAKNFPFAIVTPEGEWVESGSMGWFAMVANAKSEKTWNKICQTIFKKYKDLDVIGVDCHI
jgi:hypothetical protein